MVEQRTVETGALVDGLRVITGGLSKSDWVVVEGLQRATPGSKVAVTRVDETAATAARSLVPSVDCIITPPIMPPIPPMEILLPTRVATRGNLPSRTG
jgi:hypothetical protein